MARYDVQDTSGDNINSAVVPGNINSPVIFLAPSARTTASGELWLATSSTDSNHGGCVVWVSNDASDYKPVGRIEGQARQGVLLAALPSATGTDETNTLSVDMSMSGGELESVMQATVDRLDTLCYVGGELLAFRHVLPVDIDQYDVDYLKRGLYGSSAGASSGADFVAIDNAVFRYRFNKMAVGHLLYFKFQAFNQFGAGLQDLADCDEYAFSVDSDGGIKALLSDIGTNKSSLSFLSTNTVTGTAPTVIGATRILPVGDYPPPTALFGCGNPNYAATLELWRVDGTVLCTLGAEPGGVDTRIAAAGFTLTAPEALYLILYTNAAGQPAFIHGFEIGN